jgi:ribosomal protein S18 acetylase RimI-like enzyme
VAGTRGRRGLRQRRPAGQPRFLVEERCPPLQRPLSSAFSIRQAEDADAETLAELGVRTFRETFAKDNTPEDMTLYLAEHFGGGLQRAELLDASSVFLLLEAEGRPVGYVKLRRGLANARGGKPLEVCRFYVDRPWHGKGAALELMRAIETLALRDAHDDVWLAVWEHNVRAIRFYKRHGFVRVGEQPFRLGADVQTDWVMARAVRPGQSR